MGELVEKFYERRGDDIGGIDFNGKNFKIKNDQSLFKSSRYHSIWKNEWKNKDIVGISTGEVDLWMSNLEKLEQEKKRKISIADENVTESDVKKQKLEHELDQKDANL